MLPARRIRIIAIILALIFAVTTILGYDHHTERQIIPPAYSSNTLDF